MNKGTEKRVISSGSQVSPKTARRDSVEAHSDWEPVIET